MNKLHLMGVLSATLLFSGCATIFAGGGTQDIRFTSYPAGASVKVDGRQVCYTPCRAPIERKSSSATVTMEKEGYETATKSLSSGMNLWFFGNILFAGLLGSTTDAMTGAIHEYDDNSVHAELRKK